MCLWFPDPDITQSYNATIDFLPSSFFFFFLSLHHTSTEAKLRNKNLILDPTLPRMKGDVCPKCGTSEPVYYQPQDDNMTLAFMCTNRDCIHMWA